MAKERDWYSFIDEILKSYENYCPTHPKSMEYAANHIDWCWKWRKITKEQMEELADRATTIFEERKC